MHIYSKLYAIIYSCIFLNILRNAKYMHYVKKIRNTFLEFSNHKIIIFLGFIVLSIISAKNMHFI